VAEYPGTIDAFSAVGDREDLADVIYLLKPTEVPLMSSSSRSDGTGAKHEWQRDTLAAPDLTNLQLEGDDAPSGPSFVATQRLYNYMGISRKVVVVSGTQEVVLKAGRSSEVNYQTAKRGLELKRDVEALASQVNVSSATGGKRTPAGLESWMDFANDVGTPGGSPANRGTGGAPPVWTGGSPTTAPVDGALRGFDEDIFKNVLQQVYQQGGHTNLAIAPPKMKQRMSGFSAKETSLITSVTKYMDIEDRRLVAAIDIYVSDFGTINIQPSRFCRTRVVLVLDTEYIAFSWLRPFQTKPLADTGDAIRRLLICEWTLEAREPKSMAICADLQ
jgi:hypothetical protein